MKINLILLHILDVKPSGVYSMWVENGV